MYFARLDLEKKFQLSVVLPLVFCTFICLFYRGVQSHAHLVFSQLFTENYLLAKLFFQEQLPLSDFMIYSLPEGLWVFSLSLLGSKFYLDMGERPYNLCHLAIAFATGLECLQYFHVTDGTFDILDLGASLFFWLLALFIIEENRVLWKARPISDFRFAIFFLAFGAVYFSETL